MRKLFLVFLVVAAALAMIPTAVGASGPCCYDRETASLSVSDD